MLRRIVAVLAVFGVAFVASAGTITRPTKSNGTTSYQSGETILASEVNSDFDTIYNEFNGNIESENILDGTLTSDDFAAGALGLTGADDLSADISGVSDHCNNEVSCNKEPDRGTGTPTGLATSGAQEILLLRKMQRRSAVGDAAVLGDGDTASDQYKFGMWFDRPHFGPNLIYNGDFELKTTGATAAPDGWTLVDTPGDLSLAETAASNGEGKEITIQGDAAAEQGISQTLAGLKASTRYLVIGRVLNETGTGCGIETTGADTGTDFTNLDLADTAGSTYTTLAGIIQTDSTPTDIVVRLVTDGSAATDDCSFDKVGVYETGVDPLVGRSRVVKYVTSDDNTTTISTSGFTTLQDDTGLADLSVSVTPPSPGCVVEVSGGASFIRTTGAGEDSIALTVQEGGSAVGIAQGTNAGSADHASASVEWVNVNPTPGTTLAYTLGARSDALNFDQGGQVDGAVDTGAYIKVVMECGG